MIGAGPYAERLILMLKQRLINKRKSETDSLNCLLDMGFQRHRAQYALQLKQHVYADALRWLIENPRQAVPTAAQMETAELFEEIPLSTATTMGLESVDGGDKADNGEEVTKKRTMLERRKKPSTPPMEESDLQKARKDGEGEEEFEAVFVRESDGEEDDQASEEDVEEAEHELKVLDAGLNSFNSRKDYIETLLEIIRIHSQRDLPLCDEMVTKLMEMGFKEEEVREALQITQNNQAAACEWLIGSRSKSLTELRDGLPEDSPILKALMVSPQVQISLGNPKMLLGEYFWHDS